MSDQKPFDINALAVVYGRDFEIPQLPKEDSSVYRTRLAGILRDQGHMIEAHEVYSGRRYDDPDNEYGRNGPMQGIAGAVLLTLENKNYGGTGERLLGQEDMAGTFVGREDPYKGIATVLEALGPEAGMDLLTVMHKSQNRKD